MMRKFKGIWLLAGLVVCLVAIGWVEEQQKAIKTPLIDKLVKPARRPLTSEEVEKMTKLLTDAISIKGWSAFRRQAIFALGDEIGHVTVIPILEKIARNREEDKDIRSAAVRALARIPDEKAIEVLIGILDEAEKALKQNPKDKGAREVEGAATEVLFRLLAYPIHLIDPKKSMAENIRVYWEKVKKKIDLRKSVYVLKLLIH